jgi:hypothetical protein
MFRRKQVAELQYGVAGIVLGLGPAHVQLADPWFAAAAGRFERIHDVRVRGEADQAVAEPAGEFGATPAAGSHDDRRGLGRPSVELGVLDGEVGAAVVDLVALEQPTDQRDCFLEHLPAFRCCRPAEAGHMLVQAFPGADAEEEAARHHRRDGRGGVCYHGRVHAQDRRGDAGADPQPSRFPGDAAEHRPHKRAVALVRDPRMVVVGDDRRRETELLGGDRVVDQGVRRVLLGGEPVADSHSEVSHGSTPWPPVRCRPGRRHRPACRQRW